MKDKKQQIIDAAIELFAKEGLGVSTARIAKEANVSNGTLFNYFETKQALIDTIYIYIKEGMAQEVLSSFDVEGSLHQTLLSVWLAYSAWFKLHDRQASTLALLKTSQVLSDGIEEKGTSYWQNFSDVIEKGMENKELINIPIDLFLTTGEAYLNATIHFVRMQALPEDEEDVLIKQSFEIFWRGVAYSKR